MILPKNDECERIVKELDGDPALSQWERDFIAGNRGRKEFTDKQRAVFADLKDKFDV